MTKPRTPRRCFAPDEHMRRQVEAMAALGVPQEEICRILVNPGTRTRIGPATLKRHFRRELQAGASQATAKVLESVYRQAVGSPAQYDDKGRLLRAERKPVLSAAIFWMKTRARLIDAADLKNAEETARSSPRPATEDSLDHEI